jgi:hypothetical protein
MSVQVLSVTEMVRNFSDYINRVAYRREAFVLRRGRQALAELRPLPTGRRLGDLPAIVAAWPRLAGGDSRAFAAEVGAARATLRRAAPRDPWAS